MNRTMTLTALALLCSASFSARAGDDATVLAVASTGAVECHPDAGLTRVERQVVDKATQGIRPLAQFIYRTRMIYQLDLMQTVAWLDQRREAQRTCMASVARLAANDE
jgi:hypothetical protein